MRAVRLQGEDGGRGVHRQALLLRRSMRAPLAHARAAQLREAHREVPHALVRPSPYYVPHPSFTLTLAHPNLGLGLFSYEAHLRTHPPTLLLNESLPAPVSTLCPALFPSPSLINRFDDTPFSPPHIPLSPSPHLLIHTIFSTASPIHTLLSSPIHNHLSLPFPSPPALHTGYLCELTHC